jgi:pimeloyl-ACP methyl ester carboxylesterase
MTPMALLFLLRLVFALLSWAILGAGGYLVWSSWQGDLIIGADGLARRVRDEDWRLWVGVALLAWSFLGKWIVVPLIAGPDQRRTRPERGAGQTVTSPNGDALHVEIAGPADAPPIIFTHGWGLDCTIWFYARNDLARRFRVITWDLAGLGKSRRASSSEISLPRFAADLAAILDLAGGRPAVLVGHSIGGMTIQTLARDHPRLFADKVLGVVLLNTTYTNPERTMIFSRLSQALRRPLLEPLFHLAIWLQPIAWLSGWQTYLSGWAHLAYRFGFGRSVTRSQLEHTTLLTTRNPPAAQARGNLAMFHWDATGVLGALKTPVLVVAGQADILTKPEASRDIVESTKQAQLQVVDGVNHMGFLERPDIYNAAIEAFADAIQPESGGQTKTAGPLEPAVVVPAMKPRS